MPASVSNGAPPAHDRTAELLALQARIDETRRAINARLDSLAAAVERLLPTPLDTRENQNTPPLAPPSSTSAPARTGPLPSVRVGEDVYVPRLGGAFTVVEASPNGQTFKVLAGAIRVELRRDEVWSLDESSPAPPPIHPTNDTPRAWPQLNPDIPAIDLHGYAEADALVTLELFLHHAYTHRTPRVRVIHGKGNGILRAAVRRELARSPLVRAVDMGPEFQGDDGVTLADLDL